MFCSHHVDNHIKFAENAVPLHFVRYFPAYKYHRPPTGLDAMKTAYKVARAARIEYAYFGNISDREYQNTYCPNCGSVLIKRVSLKIIIKNVSKDH